jgi:hypothetical protein
MKYTHAICLVAPIALLTAACGGREEVVIYPESPEPVMRPASSPSPSPESPDLEFERQYETPSGEEIEIETEYDD